MAPVIHSLLGYRRSFPHSGVSRQVCFLSQLLLLRQCPVVANCTVVNVWLVQGTRLVVASGGDLGGPAV